MKRTAQMIAEKAERDSDSKPKAKRKMNPKSLANLVAPWTSENKPKSPGRPRDVAGDISRKAFESNEQAIYNAVVEKLLSGDAYCYTVHSERGYGKLKQGIIHTGDDEGGPIKASITVEFVNPDGK